MLNRLTNRVQIVAVVVCGSYVLGAGGQSRAGNLAPLGTPLLGVGSDMAGTNDVSVAHAGPIAEINDGVFNASLAPNGYLIDGGGQSGSNGNGADTFAGGVTTNAFDYVGVLFAAPQYGVASVRVQNYLANDGGWWGPTAVVAGGAPLAAADLTSPQVQVTVNGGAAWTNVATATTNYVTQYTGVVRGTGFPSATSGPFATITFAAQNGINGVRLIGNGAGPADGNGFIGVNEFEVIGVSQQLQFEVDSTTGRARIVNNLQTSISFDFYQVTSAGGSLDLSAGGWNSFENPSLNPAGFPGGSGSGNGWEKLGNLSSSIVAEAFLQGSSTLAPNQSASLGRLFTGGAQDLSLRYRTTAGAFVDVPATFLSGGLAADFDFSTAVDATDLAIWRAGFAAGAAGDADRDGDSDGMDFLVWQRQLGAVAANVASLAAVPEPTALGLLAWAAMFVAPTRRRSVRDASIA